MTHTFTVKGQRRYRYYVCNNAQQNGRAACPAPSVSSGEIEQFVVEEIKAIGRDPALVAATLAESRRLAQEATKRLKVERAALERQRRDDTVKLAISSADRTGNAQSLEIQERIGHTERRIAEIESELAELLGKEISEEQVAAALAEFDSLWAALTAKEQARILALLIERIDYNGQQGTVDITFRQTGIKALAAEASAQEETAA